MRRGSKWMIVKRELKGFTRSAISHTKDRKNERLEGSEARDRIEWFLEMKMNHRHDIRTKEDEHSEQLLLFYWSLFEKRKV